ncbi:MAG: Crp/Fnr family transcriptional regulator [Hyphomicrobiaceae bacterium]
MDTLFELCRDIEPTVVDSGETIVAAGAYSGSLYILLDGVLAVRRDGIDIAEIDSPGAFFGEISVLTGRPHTADVTAITQAKIYVRENAREFLVAHPAFLFPVARLLAERLGNATDRLVQIKKGGSSGHLVASSLDDILDALTSEEETLVFDD